MTSECEIEKLVDNLRLKTEDCFENRKMCCSESILYALNQGLRGGLSGEAAINLGTGFCGGMGAEDGCGALNGSVLAIGLLLASGQEGLTKKKIKAVIKELREKFKEEFNFEKCSDLTKPYKGKPKDSRRNCQRITGISAELTARLILQYRPELAALSDEEFLAVNESKVGGFMGKIRSVLR